MNGSVFRRGTSLAGIDFGNFVDPDFPAPIVETYTSLRHHWVAPVPNASQFEAFSDGW